MNTPLVSICIPTYNSGKFIKRTLDSVLKQDYKNLEVIVVDDCSKDNTSEVVEGYQDERLSFYINETNQGLTKNWNNALLRAKGKYVMLLCADDVIYNNCISEEVKALEENPTATMVISNTHIVNSEDIITLKIKRLPKEGLYNGKRLAKKSIRFKNYYGAPNGILFRRFITDRIGPFDENLKHIPDYDMWLRLSYEGDVYYIDKFLSAFRVHNVSNTNKLITSGRKEFAEEHVYMVKKHMKLNRIKLTNTDLRIHKTMRSLRSFMVGVFIKYFNNRSLSHDS